VVVLSTLALSLRFALIAAPTAPLLLAALVVVTLLAR
jgi:hypothetical protein